MTSPSASSFFSNWKNSSKIHAIHREITAQSQLTLRGDEQISTASYTLLERTRSHLLAELDSAGTRLPLAICCFLSGFIACVSFSACMIWTGFQSGNSVQVFIALGRLTYDPHPGRRRFYVSDWQALCSILAFAIAAQIGGRFSPWARKSRATLSTSAIIQCLLTVGAAVTAYLCNEPAFNLNRADPSWHNAYGFVTIGLLSASMGLQGVVGESLGTGYTASVVLTSIWVQLALLPTPKKWSRSRDDRISAILLFGIGAYISRLLLAKIGSHGTLAVAAGIRFALTFVWLFYCRASPDAEFLPVAKKPTLRLPENDSRLTIVASA